jgi:hypothetical protein
MNKENKIITVIAVWAAVIILNMSIKFTTLYTKLDKIENNTKQIIEYLNKGDV